MNLEQEQNTIGLANPTKWGEQEIRPYGVKRSHEVAEREKSETSILQFLPLYPSLGECKPTC